MSPELRELEEKALSLSVAEREKLASELLHSVHNQELNDTDEAWLAVAEERYEAFRSGKDIGIPEKDFFEKIRQKLGWK